MVQMTIELVRDDTDPKMYTARDFGFNSDNNNFLYIVLNEDPEESVLIPTSDIKCIRIKEIK